MQAKNIDSVQKQSNAPNNWGSNDIPMQPIVETCILYALLRKKIKKSKLYYQQYAVYHNENTQMAVEFLYVVDLFPCLNETG